MTLDFTQLDILAVDQQPVENKTSEYHCLMLSCLSFPSLCGLLIKLLLTYKDPFTLVPLYI